MASAVSPAHVRGTDIVAKALEVMKSAAGKSYTWGGKSTEGFDCSGFVSYVFGSLLPENAAAYQMGAAGFAESNLFATVTSSLPGDIICFSPAGSTVAHVGIVVDSEGWISSQSSTGVAKVKFSNPYWGGRSKTFRRLRAMLQDTASVRPN